MNQQLSMLPLMPQTPLFNVLPEDKPKLKKLHSDAVFCLSASGVAVCTWIFGFILVVIGVTTGLSGNKINFEENKPIDFHTSGIVCVAIGAFCLLSLIVFVVAMSVVQYKISTKIAILSKYYSPQIDNNQVLKQFFAAGIFSWRAARLAGIGTGTLIILIVRVTKELLTQQPLSPEEEKAKQDAWVQAQAQAMANTLAQMQATENFFQQQLQKDSKKDDEK